VDGRDISEVAFKCLTEPEKHYSKTYLLTSDKAVNYAEIAEAVSKVIGEKVYYDPIPLEEARTQMAKAGMPHALIETFLSYDQAQRDGLADVVSDSVRTVLGKPARTLEGFVRDYRHLFV
jgi:uncharacterized protein YbjT (DUF2867 family)